MTRDQILDEIRRVAAAHGGQPPGMRGFKRATGIARGKWCGLYWARWSEALKEAGFAPNKLREKSEPDFIFEKLIDAMRHYERMPTAMELRMYRRRRRDFPNEKTILEHFGAKPLLLSRLRAWIADKPGYSDITAMVGAEPPEPEPAAPSQRLVYLIRSGAHYKIGRSDDIERRVKQIRIALPESAALVHCIRTDDPAGIEGYWHRRFAARRANGEWFKLTGADVAAFKLRKFQ